MTSPVAPWETMKSLVDKFSWVDIFSTMENYINGIVMTGFMTSKLKQVQFIQGGTVIMIIMTYVASAYVICSAVEAGVEWSKGFYATYSGHSATGNLIYLWEAILITGW